MDITINGSTQHLELRAGSSTIIVGANGAGKTQLARECERQLGDNGHRISAQRMLALNPAIQKISEKDARGFLRYGSNVSPANYGGPHLARENNRWGRNNPDFILNDAGFLLQVLFAEQSNVAVKAFNKHRDGAPFVSEETHIRTLQAIFHRVLPNRRLIFTADDATVSAVSLEHCSMPYSINEMSDGEKAVLYMIGQTLVAEPGSCFIMDEPEIHIHRSILGRLWDELEAARPDCAILLITHDLEFAASRAGEKYVVRSFAPDTGWVIEKVPEAEGFSEEVVTLILGSRKPILFVEGEQGSLDLAFYRACFPGLTIIPRGGCEGVIHSVVSMRRNAALTRIRCAGLVDADGHDEGDCTRLAEMGIYILPVSEIENLLLIPSVSRVILEMNEVPDAEIITKLAGLKAAVYADASIAKNVNEVVLEFCRRRIDRALKQVGFTAESTVADLAESYKTKTREIDVEEIAAGMEDQIRRAIANDDLPGLLAIYDRKRPLLAIAASHLRNTRSEPFSAWVTRAMQSTRDDRLRQAVKDILPEITIP